MADVNKLVLNGVTYDFVDAATQAMMTKPYAAKRYEVGELVIQNSKLYRCKTKISSAETWNSAHWEETDLGDEFTNMKEDVEDAVDAQLAEMEGDVTDLKSALANNVVHKEGTEEVTPWNLQIVDAVFSKNLWNPDKTENGYISKDGTFSSADNYRVSDYIPVDAGDKYVFTRAYNNNRSEAEMRFVACYDNSKQVMSSAGSNSQITQPYTIPAGVSFIRVSTYYNSAYSKWQFEKGTAGTAYEAYGLKSAVIKNQYIPETDMSKIPAFELVEGQNLLNTSDPNYLTNSYITKAGTINSNNAYIASGYISVTPGDILLCSYKAASGNTVPAIMPYICCYDTDKAAQSDKGTNTGTETFVIPSGIKYVRISIRIASYTQYLQIEKTDSNYPKPYKAYEAPHYEIKDGYIPQGKAPLHVYLPTDIYVAVGRTIELYNAQIVADHEKYHFRWVCGKGNAYARKFSITGDSAGNQNLDLYLYDDEKNVCWIGRCVIHIVSASNPTKKILPIGDSLTNWKAWLQETMLLSSNNITWLGTRYSGLSVDSEGNEYASGTIHHEGRSGWSASDYLSGISSYTFDNRYDGVGTVAGTANPFWSGTDFSLSHYLTVQTGVDTPDAVQIFLGTNDILSGIDTAVENITAMVTKIRAEYANMPIFVCNTIFNSNQNGYGSNGNDAYSGGTGANAWQYDEDSNIIDLMVALRESLKSMTGVYLIPLATCMDREYDFGQEMTKVNPRSTVEVPMPKERIHPQAPGYYQMADVMYSTYCGVLD